MKVNKKWITLILALACVCASAGSALAEDTLIIETDSGQEPAAAIQASNTDEQKPVSDGEAGLSELETAQTAAAQTEAAGDQTAADQTETVADQAEAAVGQAETAAAGGYEALADTLVLDIQEVEATELETETESTERPEYLPDSFEGTVSESGQTANATLSRIRSFSNSVYADSYGGQLTGEARYLYDAMKAKYYTNRENGDMSVSFSTEITFSTAEEATDAENEIDFAVQSAYDALKYDYPEIFWMSAPRYKSDITYEMKNGIYVGTASTFNLYPTEIYDGASKENTSFYTAVDSVYSQLYSALGSNASTRAKVKAIHDYVCSQAVYADKDKDWSYSAAGIFLKDGQIVCEGYAKAVMVLCRKFGISSALVVGDAGEGHMWNYIKMENGNWYLLDATWDDTWYNNQVIAYNWFLLGSLSKGDGSTLIRDERLIYTNFSGSIYTTDFAVPILNETAYDEDNPEHTHTWTVVQQVTPTCMAEGYTKYVCSGCNAVTEERFDKTEHSFTGKNVVYNNDATCLQDGTQIIYCDYGCGTVERVVTAAGTKLPPAMSVNVSSIRLKKGQSTTALKVSGLGLGDYVASWKSGNTNIVTVTGTTSGTCKIKAKKTGKTTITITLASGLKQRITVRVQSTAVKTKKISNLPTELTLAKGRQKRLSPVLSPVTSSQKITCSSSNKNVATVSSKGLITAKRGGTARITVKSGSKKAVVTVHVPKTATASISGVPETITMQAGKTRRLKAVKNPTSSDYKLTYRSSEKSVVTVSSKGKITARKAGTAVITVKSGRISVQCTVTVK